MRIGIATTLLLAASLSVSAQTTKEEFKAKYDRQTSMVGTSGVGVELILDKWQNAFPDDPDQYIGRFVYDLGKCQSSKVIKLPQKKYMGNDPVIAMKDSLGNPVNFFEDIIYDDELFGQATSAVDKAIALCPDRIDYRFYKAAALLAYEKESPDLTLSFLVGLVDYNAGGRKWVYPEVENYDAEAFSASIQEYCALFYKISSPASLEAFKTLSERMLKYNSKNVMFISNLGSYFFAVKNDYKTSLKYFNTALKLKADYYPSIKNALMASRKLKDKKLEKKYLQMMIKYAPTDVEKDSAKAMLEALSVKK